MVLKTIDLETTHLTLEELLSELNANPEILLTRGISPVAKVAVAETPVQPKERILGLHEGQGWMSEDFTDELPDSFWLGEDE
ncbi:MAG: hypothetical protein K8L97_00910 [Anaerolineae bacterium]|nr:hypothetical protein [Anaerolineae bacterium]